MGIDGRARGAPPGRDALLRDDWQYIEHTELDAFDGGDWALLDAQRAVYRAEETARQTLRMLAVSRDDPTFGYQINNYHHSLQTATLMLRDGCAEDSVVMGLFHDIGFTVCPDRHAEFAADLLAPYLSERDEWVLRVHPAFQQRHIHGHPGLDEDARARYRGHPHFEAAAEFVARYDVVSINPDMEIAPLETFEPMVYRFFERPRREEGPGS